MADFSFTAIKHGDTYNKTITLTDSNDVAINVTGYKVTLRLGDIVAISNADGSMDSVNSTSGATITRTDASGIINLVISDTCMESNTEPNLSYLFEVETIDTNSYRKTWCQGLQPVERDVA